MDLKKVICFLFLIPMPCMGMNLKLGSKQVKLEQIKDYWISADCGNCEAKKVIEKLTKKEVQKALATQTDMTISLGNRLCYGLKGSVWSLKNEKDEVWSICEFKDQSSVLTDDLAGLAQKIKLK